jgi:hypothetical protein
MGSGGAYVGDVCEEELDDAIDLEIEKVRRTITARISLKGRSVAGPRGSVCGKLTDPGSDARDPSPGRWSFRISCHTVALRRERIWLRILSDRESSPG